MLDEWEPDPSVRVVVLTGAGKQFSAGADLVAMRDYVVNELPVTNEPFNARALFPLTQRIVASRLVFVAAINGGATAGGLDFALACDLRIASHRGQARRDLHQHGPRARQRRQLAAAQDRRRPGSRPSWR